MDALEVEFNCLTVRNNCENLVLAILRSLRFITPFLPRTWTAAARSSKMDEGMDVERLRF